MRLNTIAMVSCLYYRACARKESAYRIRAPLRVAAKQRNEQRLAATRRGARGIAKVLALLLVHPFATCPAAAAAPAIVPPSPFIDVVFRHVDEILAKRNPSEPLIGVSLQQEENLLRVLYTLTDYSSKPIYQQAADTELKTFLDNSASSQHKPLQSNPFVRPWVLWDRCFDVAADSSKRYALRLLDNLLFYDDPRQAGFCIRTWAVAYARTKDETFLKAIDHALARYEKSPEITISLAIDCDGAARRVPHLLAVRLRALAAREDELFCSLPHDVKTKKGFATADGKSVSPLWTARDGKLTTAAIAMMCVERYENTGDVKYRELIHAAANVYLKEQPPEDAGLLPMTLGHAISLELAAWRSTADRKYFDRASEVGTWAVAKFWKDNPLPKASLKSDHYEAITGADTLALALTELHLSIQHITALRCPPNTIDR